MEHDQLAYSDRGVPERVGVPVVVVGPMLDVGLVGEGITAVADQEDSREVISTSAQWGSALADPDLMALAILSSLRLHHADKSPVGPK